MTIDTEDTGRGGITPQKGRETMTKAQKERIEYSLNIIRKDLDRYEAKMNKAEAEGDTKRFDKINERLDMALERLQGMNTTLLILGYRVWQGKDGEPWRVVKQV